MRVSNWIFATNSRQAMLGNRQQAAVAWQSLFLMVKAFFSSSISMCAMCLMSLDSSSAFGKYLSWLAIHD